MSSAVEHVAAVNVLDYLKSERRADEERLARAAECLREDCAAEAAARQARVQEARRLAAAHPLPAAPRTEQLTRPMARRPKPTVVHVPASEIIEPDEDDEALAEFEAKLKAVQARRSKKPPMKSEPKIDGARVAAAHRAKVAARPAKKHPIRRALGPGECHRCGIRGAIGCDHFLPYLGDAQ